MVSRRGRVGALLTLLIAGVGACADGAPPAITAPPAPVDIVLWPDVMWAGTLVDRSPDGWTSERMVAMTASDLGFVAVGLVEAPAG